MAYLIVVFLRLLLVEYSFRLWLLASALVQEVGVQGVGVQEVQAPPQQFRFVKNPGKISQNLSKILESLGKIPENTCEIPKCVDKIPENLGKKWCPTLFDIQKMAPNVCEKTNKSFFQSSHQKRSSVHDFCGKKFVSKSRTTTFRTSLGKSGQKSYAPQNFACSCTYTFSGTAFEDVSELERRNGLCPMCR